MFKRNFKKEGYSKASTLVKGQKMRSEMLVQTSGQSIEDRIKNLKSIVFNLVSKPAEFNIDQAEKEKLVKEKQENKKRISELHSSLKQGNENALKELKVSYEKELDNLKATKVNKLREMKEKGAEDPTNLAEFDDLNGNKISLLKNKIEETERVISTLEKELFNITKENEELARKPKIVCATKSSAIKIRDNFIKLFENLSSDLMLLIPFIILLVVDYCLGLSFIYEYMRQKLDSAYGVIHLLLLNTIIFSISLVIFILAFVLLEKSKEELDKHDNVFVGIIKWSVGILLTFFGIAGISAYFVATRIMIQGSLLQARIEEISLILIWFAMIFACSYLYEKIKNKKSGFKPIFNLMGIPVFLILLAVSHIVWAVEYIFRLIKVELRVLMPKNRASINQIKKYKKKKTSLQSELTKILNIRAHKSTEAKNWIYEKRKYIEEYARTQESNLARQYEEDRKMIQSGLKDAEIRDEIAQLQERNKTITQNENYSQEALNAFKDGVNNAIDDNIGLFFEDQITNKLFPRLAGATALALVVIITLWVLISDNISLAFN